MQHSSISHQFTEAKLFRFFKDTQNLLIPSDWKLSQVEQRGISLSFLHFWLLRHLLKFYFMHVTSDGAFGVFHRVETKHFVSLPCCCFFKNLF